MIQAEIQSAVVEIARSLIGIPFLHQGRSFDGIDCAGVISLVAIETGLAEHWMDKTDYPHLPSAGDISERMQLFCDEVAIFDKGKLVAGSILVFDWAGDARHCGWCLGDTVIHAYSPSGKVVEHPLAGRWEKRLRSVWTPRKLMESLNG